MQFTAYFSPHVCFFITIFHSYHRIPQPDIAGIVARNLRLVKHTCCWCAFLMVALITLAVAWLSIHVFVVPLKWPTLKRRWKHPPGFDKKRSSFPAIRFWVFVGENGNLYLYTTRFVNFVSIQIQPAPGISIGGLGLSEKKAPQIQCERDRFPIHFLIQIAVQRDWSVFRQTSDPFRWSFYSTTQIWGGHCVGAVGGPTRLWF